ncbi:MAG: MarR family winged helix-turn-helix transcriptional regulator [Lysobacteraceae bacterium]
MPRSTDVPLHTTLHVRDHCLCLYAQRAARALARHFDEAFRPLDLTNGQFSLMMALNQPQPPPMGRIAAFLAMDRTTLTAALKPLQRRGLVEVRPAHHDRRSRELLLTAAGRALLAKAVPIWTREHARVEALMAPGAPAQVREALDGLARDLAAPAAARAAG